MKCSNPVALLEVAETLRESCSECLNFRTFVKLGMKLKYPQTRYQTEDQIYGNIYCVDRLGNKNVTPMFLNWKQATPQGR
jgi:hypothetical protein